MAVSPEHYSRGSLVVLVQGFELSDPGCMYYFLTDFIKLKHPRMSDSIIGTGREKGGDLSTVLVQVQYCTCTRVLRVFKVKSVEIF